MTLKSRSPLLVGLLVSVALNGALIGLLMAGGKPRGHNNAHNGGGSTASDINSIARSLPLDQRSLFTKNLNPTERRNIGDAFKALSDSHSKLAALLNEESLDTSATETLMSEIREKRTALAVLSDEALISFFETLSVEQRQNAIKRMQSRRRGQNGAPGNESAGGLRHDNNRGEDRNGQRNRNANTPQPAQD